MVNKYSILKKGPNKIIHYTKKITNLLHFHVFSSRKKLLINLAFFLKIIISKTREFCYLLQTLFLYNAINEAKTLDI